MPTRLAALLGTTIAVVLSVTITAAVLIGCYALLHLLWKAAL